jgi:hypothetical protein
MVAYTLPCQRFAGALAGHGASLGANVDRLLGGRPALRTCFRFIPRIALDQRILREARIVGRGRSLVLFHATVRSQADQI